MELKHVVKAVISVDYGDLEDLIWSHYGVDRDYYQFALDQECGNDTTQRFTVEKEKLNEYDTAEMEKWKNEEDPGYMTGTIMNDLCNHGIIEEGEYYVDVCW